MWMLMHEDNVFIFFSIHNFPLDFHIHSKYRALNVGFYNNKKGISKRITNNSCKAAFCSTMP